MTKSALGKAVFGSGKMRLDPSHLGESIPFVSRIISTKLFVRRIKAHVAAAMLERSQSPNICHFPESTSLAHFKTLSAAVVHPVWGETMPMDKGLGAGVSGRSFKRAPAI